LIVGGDEGLDFSAQSGVLGTGFIKIASSVRRIAFESSTDNFFDLLPATWTFHGYPRFICLDNLGFGDAPIAFDRSWGDTEHLGGFFGGRAAKKAKFDDTALLFIDAGETREGIVKSDDIGASGFGEDERFFANKGAVGAALGSAMMVGIVNKDLAHEASRDGDKVSMVLGLCRQRTRRSVTGWAAMQTGLGSL
jgi:hypothetical protein